MRTCTLSSRCHRVRQKSVFLSLPKILSAKLLSRTWLLRALLIALFSGLPIIKFLIACSMQKNGGGRSGSFYCTDDVSVYLGRWRKGFEGSLIEITHFMQTSILKQKQYVFHFSKVQHTSTWGRN